MFFAAESSFALFQIVEGVAGADGGELQHARVAVTVNHAAGAAVAMSFDSFHSCTLHMGVSQKWQR